MVASGLVNAGFSPTFSSIGEPFNVPGVFSADARLESDSNTGIPGFFAYRVDSSSIIQPGGM